MLKKQTTSLLAIGALGAAALLLNGCGGSSFQKNTFATIPNTVPAAYGIEPVAASPTLTLPQNLLYLETSGLGAAGSTAAYLTAASGFVINKAPDGAGVPTNIDPNGKTIPQGFSTAGQYIDAATAAKPAVPTAVAPGASVIFRAALANGASAGNSPAITAVSLTSADPEWTLGTLPLTFNDPGQNSGPLANGTYVTGTGGAPVPFALPFTTSGIHAVAVTVADAAGRQTTTTFAIPVVTATDVALFFQNITVNVPAVAATATTPEVPATPTTTAITPGDPVSLDGGTAVAADAQGTAIFFTAPGTHTIREASADGMKTVQTATFTLAASTAGTTVFNAVDAAVPPAAAAKARRSAALRRH